MSSNAFMQTVLPQLPAPGLKGIAARGPAAFKSERFPRSTDENSSFSATLKRISDRHCGGNHKTAVADKPAATSRQTGTDSPKPQKMGKTFAAEREAPAENEAPVSPEFEKSSAPVNPLKACGGLVYQLMNLPMTDEGSLAAQPLPDSAAGSGLFRLDDWIGHLQLQGQPGQSEPVSIGPFEQLPVDISPEATNRLFFEQLALQTAYDQDSAAKTGRAARFFEFWQWMAGTRAPAEALNSQVDSSGVNGNLLPNPLLHLPGTGTTGTAFALNPETGSSGGPNGASGPEVTRLSADLLLKMATLSQTAETGKSENAKMAVADPGNRLSFWAPGDASFETPPEAQGRQMSANFLPLKIQAALQAAAEQPANQNSAAEGTPARTPEEVFGLKSTALKSEIAPGDLPVNKIIQIDGESKGSGLLFSQDQMPQHMARLENAFHSSEAAQRSLMPQTLDQIVQKAVLSLNNGQHEVQIDLKPDFLGHIRMQIVSEGHQVAIKIVAELPFVRDMLENNLHQLRAVLQAQGLDIDELEVSVAHDSQGQGDTRQAAEAAKLSKVRNGMNINAESSEEPDQSKSRDNGTLSETAIDYFA